MWHGLGAVGFALAAASLTSVVPAHAYEAKADGQAYLQLYSVQGLYGAPVLNRQRLTYNLGADVVNLAGSPWSNEPWVTVRFRVRLDSDYGISPAEQDPKQADYFVPGIRSAPFDIQYAYVEGGGWLRNTTGFRIGRQLFFDELGWWALDGARVSFSPGQLFELAAYTGFEQRGGLPLTSTSRYEAGGVYRGDRQGLAAAQWPGFLQSTSVAPAVGASLILLAVPRLQVRLDYRRVWQRDQVVTSPFLDANGGLATTSVSRISTERAGIGLGYDFGESAATNGAAVYDLYRSKVVEHRAALQSHLLEAVSASVSYQYRLPTYDADSIFNWFGAVGSTLVRGRVGIDLRNDLNLGVTMGTRWYGAPEQSGAAVSRDAGAGQRDGLGGLDATWHTLRNTVRIAQTAEVGDAGDRWIGDAWIAHRLGGALEPSILLTMAHWRDRLRSEFNSTVLTYVLACRFSPKDAPRLGVDWEHSISDVAQQRYRIVGTVEVRWP
jgi:hypothetical protein